MNDIQISSGHEDMILTIAQNGGKCLITPNSFKDWLVLSDLVHLKFITRERPYVCAGANPKVLEIFLTPEGKGFAEETAILRKL